MSDYEHTSNYKKILEKIDSIQSLGDLKALKNKLKTLEQDSEVIELLSLCDSKETEIRNSIKEEKYKKAVLDLKKEDLDIDYLIKIFQELDGYKDSSNYLETILYKEKKYRTLVEEFESGKGDWFLLHQKFVELGNYKKAPEYSKDCILKKEEFEKKKESERKAKYSEALDLLKAGEFERASDIFSSLGEYKDSQEKAKESRDRNNEIEGKKRTKTLIFVLVGTFVLVLGIMLCTSLINWRKDDNGHWHDFLNYKLSFSEHDYDLIYDSPPSCEKSGIKAYKCKICGWSYSEDIEKLGHTYDVVTIEATCTRPGTKTYTCTRCGKIEKTETIPAVGHAYALVDTKEPTCVASGEKVYSCLVCGESYSEVIPADDNHQFGETTVIKEPTCEERGLASMTCLLCGYSETIILDAKGHSWDKSEVIKDATCDEDGSMSHKCLVCGKSEIVAIPAIGHSFNVISEQKPDCIQKGIRVLKCEICGTVKKDYYSEAFGHDYNDGLCLRCGFDRNIYSVGMVGPAGGIIIYDREAKDKKYSDWVMSSNTKWRFLEIAPSALEKCVFGNSLSGNKPSTNDSIGAGVSNTKLIVNFFGDYVSTSYGKQTTQYAAKVCYEYNLNGFNDWFLPSKYELLLFNKDNRNGKDLWSSSFYHNDVIYVDKNGYSCTERYGSYNTYFIQPMRAF